VFDLHNDCLVKWNSKDLSNEPNPPVLARTGTRRRRTPWCRVIPPRPLRHRLGGQPLRPDLSLFAVVDHQARIAGDVGPAYDVTIWRTTLALLVDIVTLDRCPAPTAPS
jgi:hypothetical protein